MSSLNDILMRDPIRLLVWSQSGGGKTTLIGRMAAHEELRPIYIFDWDLRIGSLQSSIPQEHWQYIHSDPYRDSKIQGEAFVLMNAKLERLEAEGYKTVAIDSGTFMMDGLMNRVLLLDGNKPATSIPQLQNYNAQKSMAVDFISRLCSKKLNVVFTAHEGSDKDDVTGRMFKAIDITGKLATRLPGYFNEFWHCEIEQLPGKEPRFVVRTKGDMIFAARTSYKLDGIEPAATIWDKVMQQRRQLLARVAQQQQQQQPAK